MSNQTPVAYQYRLRTNRPEGGLPTDTWGEWSDWRDGQIPNFTYNNSYVKYQQRSLYAEPTSGSNTLEESVREYVDAVDALIQFEKDHPNDSTSRWDKFFDDRCNKYDDMVRTLKFVEAS